MSQTDWQAVRSDYENGMSLRALAAKYGVSKSVIGERKYKEKWQETRRTDERTSQNTQEVINRDVNAGVRAAMALKLRTSKLTYDSIAKQCGYASPGAARKAVQREMQRVIVTNVEELRHEELLLLDTLQRECYLMAMDKENVYRTYAVDRLLSISKRRSELMGLDVLRENNIATAQVVIREVPNGYLGEVKETM